MDPVGNVACARCGSLRARVLAGGILERVLALALAQQVIACGRCGFRGRQPKAPRAETGRQRSAVRHPAATDEAAIDLAALDRALDDHRAGTPPRKGDV